MATWKKVIVSGSNADLNQITASGGINAVLPSSQQANFVSYNLTTGQLGYFNTGSLTAATASYITSSNVFGPFGSNSILSASHAVSASNADFLDGQHGSFYQNASNINAGTIGNQYLPAAINVTSVSASFTGSLTGALIGTASWATNATTATTATTATNANNVAVTDTTTGTGPYYVMFADGTTGNRAVRVDSSTLTFNATSNVLTVTSSFASASLSSSYAVSSSYTLFATSASYASSALSSSYAISSSYTLFATTASFATSVNNISSAIAGNTDNRVLTATGGGTINGEGNLTFDGTTLTVTGNEIITGNLIVQGTASFQNTTNLEVADRFILLASGSNSAGDGGLIIQQANQNVGELLGYENSINRWGFTSSFSGASSSFTAVAYVTTTEVGTTAPPTSPIYGGSSNGFGNIYVRSSTEEIFIYS
jgi:hypothetical protein